MNLGKPLMMRILIFGDVLQYKLPSLRIVYLHSFTQLLQSFPPPPITFLIFTTSAYLPNPSLPWLVIEDVMQATNLLVSPQRFVNDPQGLERIIAPRKWFPLVFKKRC